MKGLLIVNNFVNSTKFSEIYQLLLNSASKLGIKLDVKKSGQLLHNLFFLDSLPFDFILFWDKDVLLAKMLEQRGYKVFNSADSIFFCDNKGYTALYLEKCGINTPLTFVAPLTYEGLGYNDIEFADSIIEKLGFPLIIKELYGSFGKQVYLVHNRNEMTNIIKKIGHKGFLFQEFISHSSGKDVRINVVGDQVVSSMLRYSVNGDFRSNITNGGQMLKYETSAEQNSIAINACRALKLDFAGVDIMFGRNNEPIICEVNSNPHFKSSLDCTGIDMSPFILSHIKRRVLEE